MTGWLTGKPGRIALLVILAGGAAAFFVSRRGAPGEAPFKRGQQLEAIAMDADAKAAYEEAIRVDPRFAPPYRALALMAVRLGAPDVSAHYWQEYIARAPNGAHAYCQLADAEQRSGHEVEALRDAEADMKQAPDCPRANLIAGMLYTRKSEAKRALDHLAIAAKAYPNDLQTQLTYGRVLAQTGDFDRAENRLQSIVERDKSHAQPYYWLGYVSMRRPASPENLRRAGEFLDHALALLPDYPEANVEMGKLRLAERKPAEALVYARKATSLAHHDPAAYFLLAQAFEAAGRQNDARFAQARFKQERELASREKSLLKSYGLDTKNVDTAIALAEVASARGKADSGLAVLRMTAQQVPNNPRLEAAIHRTELRVKQMAAAAPPPPESVTSSRP